MAVQPIIETKDLTKYYAGKHGLSAGEHGLLPGYDPASLMQYPYDRT